MRDHHAVELIPLGDNELETIAGGMFGLEPFIQAMQAMQLQMKVVSDTMQNLSAATMETVRRSP
jgi:hypothetical protein